MADDLWAEAWSKLTVAVENAFGAGMTEEEILEAVENAKPQENVEPHVGGGPKKKA